ncbi:4-hydroxy-tetrahydrodipicolinate reductase 2 chloroplastic [Zea mays]|uniref:4-hydroxy-tetrahydrodipicolinate reductase 2 chloroplastic n=1 Tax=Zea mays TaxID=4577 RepID=A0A1D6PYZ9_MAIZE|nr:4-hydroxy-tetrahydrodipicolinate reductase 2 chloroplastic [Zea mays]
MISTTVAAHPATVTALRRRYPLRPRQPLCAPIFTAATRQCMATAKPSVTNALANLSVESAPAALPKLSFPILVNSCTGKMGKAVAEAAVSAGLQLVPVSFSAIEVPDRKIEICDREIFIHDPSESEKILPTIVKEYPNVIVVDYTVPDAVNGECISNCY